MRFVRLNALAVVCLILTLAPQSVRAQAVAKPGIKPAELVTLLKLPKAQQPLIIQIGFRVMFQQAHIPGSEFIGPGADATAIEQLKKRVQNLSRTASIVLYCGCCPWDRCPNVTPAAKALAGMGFTNVKLLDIPTDFGTDWVSKGYPVQKGS